MNGRGGQSASRGDRQVFFKKTAKSKYLNLELLLPISAPSVETVLSNVEASGLSEGGLTVNITISWPRNIKQVKLKLKKMP